VGVVRGEIYRAIGWPQDFGVVVGPGVSPSVYEIMKVGHGSSIQSINVRGVNLERALEQGARLMKHVASFVRGSVEVAVHQVPAAQRQIDGVGVRGAGAFYGLGL